jgi:hypothetical protein
MGMSQEFKITTVNMKYLFLAIFLSSFFLVKAQSSKGADSVGIYISRLSWNSFVIGSTYVPQFALSEDAKRLIEIKDKLKIKMLVDSIQDSRKTVVIHMILSQLLDPSNRQFGESYNYGKDSTVKSVVFSYNGLKWARDSLQENSISEAEINRIERYWRKRCRF